MEFLNSEVWNIWTVQIKKMVLGKQNSLQEERKKIKLSRKITLSVQNCNVKNINDKRIWDDTYFF